MDDTIVETRVRPLGRGAFVGGVFVTLLIHGALLGLVWWAQVQPPVVEETTRDLMVTKLVKFGKPREKHWLPRIVQPPPPQETPPPVVKVTDNVEAPPAPPREAPKPEDKDVRKDLKRALQRAREMARNLPAEPEEGLLTGSDRGTTNEASEGDAYATAIYEAIRKNWNVPQGMSLGAVANLETEVVIKISEDGSLIGQPARRKSSGSDLFDDSCVQAIQAARLPAPPPAQRAKYRRGLVIACEGKDLAR
jgi:outer membrane biosynthesis protein TonB